MTLGDPKKAKLMAIIAIGSVAFMVIELLPAPNDGPSGSTPRQDDHSAALAALRGSGRLARDPFSSALLLKVAEPDAPAKPRAATVAKTSDPLRPLGPVELEPAQIPGLPPAGTKEPVTLSRAKVAGSETLVTVQATLRIDDEVAMISIGKNDPGKFRAGAPLANGIRLASIDSDGVLLDHHGHLVRVEVGQAVKI